jgi:hypothetical protein
MYQTSLIPCQSIADTTTTTLIQAMNSEKSLSLEKHNFKENEEHKHITIESN